jgi:2-hydroxy-6-oxo-octa-2,4-dienoate hydrolase
MDQSNTSEAAVSRQIDAAGHRTNLLDAGSGPAVVLLHGSGPGVSAWANWNGVLGAIAARHRVVAPDIAGFGRTELKANGEYDIKVWVGHLIGILDALGIERVPLVGNSFGGGIALATALRHPDRVDRLVLMGTPAGEFVMTDGLRGGWEYEPSEANMATLLKQFPYDLAWVTTEMVRERFAASAQPGAQAAYRRLLPAPEPQGDTIVRGVPERALRTITHPTLVLHGRDDRVVPFSLGLRLHDCIDNSELHAFGRCGHWVQIERRDRFVELTLEFLGREAV